MKVDIVSWKPTRGNSKRIKEGIRKYYECLEQDAKEDAKKGSGLPKDWRNRIIKELAGI